MEDYEVEITWFCENCREDIEECACEDADIDVDHWHCADCDRPIEGCTCTHWAYLG